MNESSNNKKFMKILILNTIVLISLSMVHPITPKLINENNLPTFYFGLLYGCLNISTFLASPTFGIICDMYGKKTPMLIGVFGYLIGQIIFGFFPNNITVLIARIISGTFISGYYVASMSYVSSITSKEQKLKRLSYLNASTSLGVALGSFLGGSLGKTNYKLTFVAQIIICIISIVLISIFFKDNSVKNKNTKFVFKVFNIQDFMKVKSSNKLIFIILMAMILTYLGIQSYTSTISYYVEDILMLPTTINGLILGSTGIFTLITNLIIIPLASKKFSSRSLYLFSVLVSGVSIIISMIAPNPYIGVIFLLTFITTHTLIAPIMQAMLLETSKDNHGEILGLQNGFKAIGSFFGSISSGIIFDIWFKLPFFISGISLILCFIILKSFKQKNYNQL